jgi:hypothetical protein
VNIVRFAVFAFMAMALSGCWWGAILDGDTTVKVNNKTDDRITVVPVGSLYGDDMYTGQRRDIGSGHSEYFHFDGFETDPKIEAKYKGIKKIFDVDIDFWGYDEINIKTFQFVNADG